MFNYNCDCEIALSPIHAGLLPVNPTQYSGPPLIRPHWRMGNLAGCLCEGDINYDCMYTYLVFSRFVLIYYIPFGFPNMSIRF